jgi:hypothetical protein
MSKARFLLRVTTSKAQSELETIPRMSMPRFWTF